MLSLENYYAFQSNDISMSHLLAITHKFSFGFDSNYEIMDILYLNLLIKYGMKNVITIHKLQRNAIKNLLNSKK